MKTGSHVVFEEFLQWNQVIFAVFTQTRSRIISVIPRRDVELINSPSVCLSAGSVLPSGSVTRCLSVTPKLSKLQQEEKNNHCWSGGIRSDRFSFISSYSLLISL